MLGIHISTLKGYAFKSGWYSDDGTPIIKVTNFTDDSVDTNNITFIPDQIAKDYSRYLVLKKDIVIQTVGSWPNNPKSVVGKVIRIPEKASGALLNQNAVKIEPDESLDKEFLFYVLKSDAFKQYIIGTAQGAANQASITLDAIRGYSFKYFPLPTQGKIASILSAYDDLIENNTRRIKILEEMARMIYHEWFVNFRFPSHEKVKMVDSPLGKIPEGWEVVALKEVCERITDGAHNSPKSQEVGYPMASVKDMHDYGLNIGSCRKISEDDFNGLVRNDCKVKKDDVLIAKDGSYLKHCFVVEKDLDVVLLSSIAILRPNNKIRPHLLASILKDPIIKERMKGYVSGVALPRIVLKDFREFQIIHPPTLLQDQWGIIFEPMIDACWNLIAKNENLRQTRDLLLPKLISGELDVDGISLPEVEGC